MRTYHNILVKSNRDKRVGNHKVKIVQFVKGRRNFYYHGNLVCMVDDVDKVFELDDCGWGGSRSTKECLAGYREYFTSIGYKQINPQPIYNYEYNNKK